MSKNKTLKNIGPDKIISQLKAKIYRLNNIPPAIALYLRPILAKEKILDQPMIVIPPNTVATINFNQKENKIWGAATIISGSGSQLTLIQRQNQTGAAASLIVANPGAKIDYAVITKTEQETIIKKVAVVQAQAIMTWYPVALATKNYSALIKSEVIGQGSQCKIIGLLKAAGQSQSTISLEHRHFGKQTVGDIFFRAIGNDQAQATVNGLIKIELKAKQTNSYLTENALLLTDQCSIKADPHLEILNNDVKASHSATVATLDEQAMAYLASRGLKPKEAEQLLVEAFYQAVINKITVPAITTAVKHVYEN